MATNALAWRRFVKKNSLSTHHSILLVTEITINLHMGPLQGKICPFLMVEYRGLPFLRVVTLVAIRVVRPWELACVNIFVTSRTAYGGCAERHFVDLSSRLAWLVTILALHFDVGAEEREGSLRMVEARKIGP
jgi:hypothetical protein